MSGLAQMADQPRLGEGHRRRALGSAAAIALLLAAGGADAKAKYLQAPPSGKTAGYQAFDPLEKVNRRFYAAHQRIDHAILRPAALAYERLAPRPIRMGIRNFLSNLDEPVVFANDVLQLRIKSAAETAARFAANSTFGGAGLFDPATKVGLPHHDNGFGLTMARAGLKPGPYLFLPLIGPSTMRDLLGSAVDLATNPFFYVRYTGQAVINVDTTIAQGLDERAEADPELENIDATATDSYATLRSLYLQNRQSEVTGGQVDIENLPDFGDPVAAEGSVAQAPAAAADPTIEPAAPAAATDPPPATVSTAVAEAPTASSEPAALPVVIAIASLAPPGAARQDPAPAAPAPITSPKPDSGPDAAYFLPADGR